APGAGACRPMRCPRPRAPGGRRGRRGTAAPAPSARRGGGAPRRAGSGAERGNGRPRPSPENLANSPPLCALLSLSEMLARAVLVVALVRGPRAAHAADRPLLLISVDGLSWNNFVKHRSQLPTLDRLATQGVALPLEPSFPTMTWSTHTTLVTG